MPDFGVQHGSSTKVESLGDIGTTYGTEVSASASTNTKGSWVEMIASTSFDYNSLVCIIAGSNLATRVLLDVGIGSAGNEEVIISNIAPNNTGGVTDRIRTSFKFPVSVPVGTRISVRIQSNTSSETTRVGIYGVGGGSMDVVGVSRMATYGADTATTKGTPVDAGGTVQTKGAYAELTASTTEDIQSVIMSFGSNGNAALANAFFSADLAIGAAASEQIIVGDMFFSTSSISDGITPSVIEFPVSIPSGSRISMRTQASTNNATDRVFTVIVYGAV